MANIAPAHYRKVASGFQPVSDAARQFWSKTPLGKIVALQGRRPRNPGHHRKLFALLGLVADNCEQFSGPDDVLIMRAITSKLKTLPSLM